MMGGTDMKRWYDALSAIILLLILVITIFIGNALIKGIVLLSFSFYLIFNTAKKLKDKWKSKLGTRIFFGILLLFDIMLAIAAIAVIISAVTEW
jgi:hypothetical protein